ncbi:hypothetical protein EDC04DRAFT_2894168 [Pisolithus marmoratus]|nr:hypothetical protein EDC04DRAFT_2894168 [Pisolithus marmoratus]
MSLRRRSTTYDLATLRLHPDGSRVQQSSASARPRTAKYTVIDARDPPEVVIGRSFESKEPSGTTGVSFSPPAPDLLKSIHHFATCYYGERGQLSDCSRALRMEKRERKRENIHMMAAKTKLSESDEEMWEDQDGEIGQSDDSDDGVSKARATSSHGPGIKDMYKAFDGSALMAIGILIQEQIAHILTSSSGV